MRPHKATLIVSLCTFFFFGIVTLEAAEKARPNILFIMTDQHHAKMLSSAGNPYLKTKALDRLAERGIRFTNAYAANPVCVPSRISMATGVMPGRFGVFTNGMKPNIPDEVSAQSLGNLLNEAGYDTFYGGKSHLPPKLNPLKAGYDEYFKDQREKLSGACVEFMARERDKPFFAVASFINPHDICFAYKAKQGDLKGYALVKRLYEEAQSLPEEELPPLPANSGIQNQEPEAVGLSLKEQATTPAKVIRESYSDRDWRNYRWIYCRLTERVDAQIGELLEGLKEHGLEENTLVVFTSDHGDMDGSHRLASKNVFYEESAGVPYIMRYKGVIPEGVVDEESLVSNGLDTLPTIAEAAGVTAPEYLLGSSLLPVASEKKGASERRPYVVAENETGRMLRTLRYKYCVYHFGNPRESLVDLQADPGEMNNLANHPEYRDVLEKHRRYLQDWIVESEDEEAKTFAIAPDFK